MSKSMRDAKGRPLVAVTGMGDRHLARPGPGRQLGRRDGRALRHPRHHALPDRGPAHEDRRHDRFHCRRAVLRAGAVGALRHARGRGGDRPGGHRPSGDFPGRALHRRAARRVRVAAAPGARRSLRPERRRHLWRPPHMPPRRAASRTGTTCSCSARSPTASPTASAPRARRSRCRPPAPPARPRSSSASRRSAAARPRRRSASAPTARSTRNP